MIENQKLSKKSSEMEYLETNDNLNIHLFSEIKIEDKSDIAQVKTFAFLVCRQFLGGAWKNIDLEEFNIQKMS